VGHMLDDGTALRLARQVEEQSRAQGSARVEGVAHPVVGGAHGYHAAAISSATTWRPVEATHCGRHRLGTTSHLS
jgi:hypothetical protein